MIMHVISVMLLTDGMEDQFRESLSNDSSFSNNKWPTSKTRIINDDNNSVFILSF